MKKEKKQELPVVMATREETPIKFSKQEGESKLNVALTVENGCCSQTPDQILTEILKEIVGVKDYDLARQIFDSGVNSFASMYDQATCSNIVAQTLHDIQPKDAIEARLAVQASALFSHGLRNLRKSAEAEMIFHSEHFVNKAMKLIRLHNETMEALNRYRRGGEQKVTVTHSVVANQAVVNVIDRGGRKIKKGGITPCSEKSAEQKQEPIAISHVGNQQCLMEDVAFMEEKVRVLKQ